MTFDESVEILKREYQLSRRANSKRSLDFHLENLSVFKKFLEKNNPLLLDNVEKITLEVIDDFVLDQKERLLEDITIGGRVKTLRVYYQVLSKAGYLPNICENYKFKFRTPEKIVPYSEAEMELMENTLSRSKKYTDIRLEALIKLVADTGIRLAEASNLNVNDLNLKRCTVQVIQGKWGKSRIIPFGEISKRSLLNYLDKFNINKNELYTPLFRTIKGKRWARRSIQDTIQKFGEKLGLNECNCHKFRHYFAITFLLNGGTAPALKHFLGHSTYEMVDRYVNIVQEKTHMLFISSNDQRKETEYKKPPITNLHKIRH